MLESKQKYNKLGKNCVKKLNMGKGISNAQREKEAHGKKNTKQLNPQKNNKPYKCKCRHICL